MATITRSAAARWNGGLKDGSGTLTVPTGTLSSTPYSFHDRFEDGDGTNPEELVAAAHAGCFSMALSGQLGTAGITADSIQTDAVLEMDKEDGGWRVRRVRLSTTVTAPGADEAAIRQAADNAKDGCPISNLLDADISLQVTIVNAA